MKRILIFAGYFLPHTGGYEVSLFELSKMMVKRGYKIVVLTCNTENMPVRESREGLLIYRLPSWNILGGTYPIPKPTWVTLEILWRLLEEGYDLVQTTTRLFVTSFIGLIFSKLKKKPLIHVELGSRHSVVSNRIVDIISRTYDHTLGALVVMGAAKLICNCNATGEFLKHLGAKKTIDVIPTAGVDTLLFRRTPTDLKDRMGLNNAMVVTSVSRLIYAKGVQDIILAFRQIKHEAPSVKLLIVGDGPFRQELEKLAQEVDSENILFLGQLPHGKVAEVLKISDILINASYSEALVAYPVLEAGAMGIPSVTTDAGGTREIIEDYKTGLLVSPRNVNALAEKACELIRREELRKRLGRNIQHVVKQKFNWEKVVHLYCREIESI